MEPAWRPLSASAAGQGRSSPLLAGDAVHQPTVGKRLLGKRRRVGRCASGTAYEQEMEIRKPAERDPQR